jgi:ACT domain-containing protein
MSRNPNEQIVDTIDAVEAVQTAKVEKLKVEPKPKKEKS